MTKVITAEVPDSALESDTAFSDRFVYSNYFVPLVIDFDGTEVPIIPFPVKNQLLGFIVNGVWNMNRVQAILDELGYEEMWEKNDLEKGLSNVKAEVAAQKRARKVALTKAKQLSKAKSLAKKKTAVDPATMALQETKIDYLIDRKPSAVPEEDSEVIAGLLRSTVGYAFLDRTRIRPAGFAIGEHVYALGLAPSEEVVLEQKNFTKRETTFEEQTEQEQQFEIELSSEYTTELQEGLERQRSLTDTWGFGIGHTGSYQSPYMPTYGQFNASHTINYSKEVTNASSESSRRSVKDGQTSSSKVSGKYRTQHKTSFKVSTEQGFEATSRRTIRNPNRGTPITLHYFKIMQRLELSQERYGARLCWAPAVQYPARTFLAKLDAAAKKIRDDAEAALPAKPQMPVPVPPTTGGPTAPQTKTFVSAPFEPDKWSWTGGMSADYDIDIPVTAGWEWNGKIDEIVIDVDTQRKAYAVTLVGTPRMTDGYLRARIHVGTGEWINGPKFVIQLKANFDKFPDVPAKTTADADYQAAMNDWRARVAEWEDTCDAMRIAARKAADEYVARMRGLLSPVNEMISQIIDREFTPQVHDESWEIEFWQRLFDWQRASIQTYPSWWSNNPPGDPTLDPSSFVNASWAKLYLPVRAGLEREALRWIYGRTVAAALNPGAEKAFTKVIKDLEAYRKQHFGTVDEQPELAGDCPEITEKIYCMGKWHELMPTDGTHIEVVQSATSAADTATQAEIDDAAALRQALNESQQRSTEIKDKAITKMTAAADLDVNVNVDGEAG